MVKFTETKTEDLIKRIENLKAERERTADCLERLEAELERRKQEVPLGVPAEGNFCVNFNGKICEFNNKHSVEEMEYNIFNTSESAEKHSEMLLAWRKDGLLANSKGEQIDIKVLLPLLRKGWVAMDKSGNWWWYSGMPIKDFTLWRAGYKGTRSILSAFNIKPAEDWETSLMECGL